MRSCANRRTERLWFSRPRRGVVEQRFAGGVGRSVGARHGNGAGSATISATAGQRVGFGAAVGVRERPRTREILKILYHATDADWVKNENRLTDAGLGG